VTLAARARARLRAWWEKLLAEHAAPNRLALAVLLGAIVGCTPLFGLHFFLCVGLAVLLRLNKVAMYAAANVSIPPLVPLLGFASVQLGERMRHGRWLTLAVADFRRDAPALAGRFFVDWLAGGVLVGAAIGVPLAAVVWAIARARRRAAADPVHAAIVAASRRYRAAPRPMRFYAWFKYRLDPCYRAIAPLVPDGAFLVDLGTGLGMLPLVTSLLPGERRALGIDWDGDKLAAGRRAAEGLPGITLMEGDVRTVEIPRCDVITLVDVLHYYEPEAQRALLARCAAALGEGGRLLIREGDGGRRGGARFTRSVEGAAVRVGWNRGEGKTRFRPVDELQREVEALGFTVERRAVAGRLHPGNVLLHAIRGSAENPAEQKFSKKFVATNE